MSRIDTFLEMVLEQGGSDLHLVSGEAPRMRIHGEIFPIKYRQLSVDETLELVQEVLPESLGGELRQAGQVDFSYEIESRSRFRVNAFLHHGGAGAIIRVVPTEVRTLDELGLPPVLKSLCRRRIGFVLVTGPTGSGKSTTLGAMVEEINRGHEAHIITIEQPVEIVYRPRKSLISQREVGTHVRSFNDALRSALREDPDVIVVGEMRDLETIRLAVTAAEMGSLVFGTLHTVGAVPTVERIINAFPGDEQDYIRSMLSTSLSGVVSQALLRRADGQARVAAVEVLVNNPAASNLIREGKVDQLRNIMQGGALQGMQTFDNALRKLVDGGSITGDEAYEHAYNKTHFRHLRKSSALG